VLLFFRNRTNTYLKTKNPKTGELYTAEEAEALAFIDFESISEESQQSARTDRISMQQASGAGRIVLAFANTPMQYMRIQKKAMQDILAGRGDTKSNISKLAYYGVIQNVAFNAIQNALYTEMFEDDEEDGEVGKDTKAKSWDIINGMLDSSLRGMGIGGAGVSAMKNSILTLADEATKKSPRFIKAIDDLFDFSPPLDSKVRKLKSAANTFSWERDTMEKQGFDIDNPAMLASAQVLSAFTNIPADRALMKLNNLRNAASKRAEAWQTIALLLGVSAWEVGMPYYGVETMQEESDRIKEDDEKELLRLAKLEKARLAKLAKKREARRKLEERIRADERKRIEKENKKKKMAKNKLKIDLNGNDIVVDMKTLIMVVGGIISLTLTYATLKAEIEIAKQLPVAQEINYDLVKEKQEQLEAADIRIERQLIKRLERLEKKHKSIF